MRRTVMTEKQRACALLLAAGQHSYREIGQMIDAHYNSISSWARDKRIQELIEKFQSDIEHKLEDMSIEATRRKHDRLIVQAVEKLEKMLTSKSTRRQLEAIKLLLTYGKFPAVSDEPQDDLQEERPSRIRLDPEAQAWLKAQ